jgi:hypothetical protein
MEESHHFPYVFEECAQLLNTGIFLPLFFLRSTIFTVEIILKWLWMAVNVSHWKVFYFIILRNLKNVVIPRKICTILFIVPTVYTKATRIITSYTFYVKTVLYWNMMRLNFNRFITSVPNNAILNCLSTDIGMEFSKWALRHTYLQLFQ